MTPPEREPEQPGAWLPITTEPPEDWQDAPPDEPARVVVVDLVDEHEDTE